MEQLAREAETEDDIPLCLRTRPQLNAFQIDYWQAYLDLNGSRQFTAGGIADIPYPAKLQWLDEHQIFDPDERNDYLQMISALDSTYLEQYYIKHKVT